MPGRGAPGKSGGSRPLAHLETEGPRPLYAIDGDDRLLVEEAVAEIKARALPKQAADFNFDLFIGKEATAQRILDAAGMLPAFAERRVVIVKDADKLDARTMEALIPYIKAPSPTTTLVFVADKLDARTKFYRALNTAKATLRFNHPDLRQMPIVVRERAKRAGLTLDDGAVRALVDAVGTDIGAVVSALEKISLYVAEADRGRVGAEVVHDLVSPIREEAIWGLADAIGDNKAPEALRLLHSMLSISRDHPLPLLGAIASHWRKMTVARALLDDGASRVDIASALGTPDFVAGKISAQARRQPIERLTAGLRAIAAADQALKGGPLPGPRVLERLILTLTP